MRILHPQIQIPMCKLPFEGDVLD